MQQHFSRFCGSIEAEIHLKEVAREAFDGCPVSVILLED